jgi:hypothetical protein
MSQQTATCGFAKTAQKVYQTNGLRGFGRGLAGTAVRDAAFSGGYLYGAKSLKDFYTQYMSPPKATLAGGVSAGLLAAAVSQPADTLKTMQQSSQSKTVTPLWALAQKTYTEQGLKGFYGGSMPRSARVVSAVTLMSTVKEKLENLKL